MGRFSCSCWLFELWFSSQRTNNLVIQSSGPVSCVKMCICPVTLRSDSGSRIQFFGMLRQAFNPNKPFCLCQRRLIFWKYGTRRRTRISESVKRLLVYMLLKIQKKKNKTCRSRCTWLSSTSVAFYYFLFILKRTSVVCSSLYA